MDLQPWDYWDANGQPKGHTAEVVSQLESVIAARSEARGCTASLRPRGRGIAGPGARRGRCGHAARTAAGLRSPGAHAGAHLRARRALSRRGASRTRRRSRPTTIISRSASRARASIRSATCRTITISSGSRRPWKARARSRSTPRRTTGETHERSAAHAHARLRGDAELLAVAAGSRTCASVAGSGDRDAEARRRPAVHAGDVELRPGHGGGPPGPDRGREAFPRGARAARRRIPTSRR